MSNEIELKTPTGEPLPAGRFTQMIEEAKAIGAQKRLENRILEEQKCAKELRQSIIRAFGVDPGPLESNRVTIDGITFTYCCGLKLDCRGSYGNIRNIHDLLIELDNKKRWDEDQERIRNTPPPPQPEPLNLSDGEEMVIRGLRQMFEEFCEENPAGWNSE